MDVYETFKSVGQPTITYVKRDSGKLEKILDSALSEKGQICLVTGPSKTGKTTLYTQVLSARKEVPLIVRCDRSMSCKDIWLKALEAVEFERIETRNTGRASQISAESEVSGKLGWQWLAEAATKIKGAASRQTSENEARRRVLSEPGAESLIPLLKKTNYILVIEDFHYLPEEEKSILFQQWKKFVDSEVSAIVLGTTHRAVDIANGNKDLIGRICQIDVGRWSQADLEQICQKGFDHLKIPIHSKIKNRIASEAVGLPIIVQQICLDLIITHKYFNQKHQRNKIFIDEDHLVQSFHNVALQKYSQFDSYYKTLVSGPRENVRKYRTYELVIACFTIDPITFVLKRGEIDQRLRKLKLKSNEIPPTASLNSTLGALKKFQERRNFDLLEWRPSEEKLYIVEPSFLFYIRWRSNKPEDKGRQLDFFERLFERINLSEIINSLSTKTL
ncbi:ATP-binding protein [Pseudoroseomonas cervicalis]|uniref:ATP-binding protein n=1 Tax=Teichococcus cervicalis TaxID=204525 RepID=UPI0022F1D3A1|nr:ATP-binding protein [Pseudoroseomonas cervicalis]WBV43825.1 ATP-binding protein [Pseudoroseomonas cervicalis]